MNFKKICRSLVCLLLVACMLVSISPVRANATGLVESVGAVLVSNPLALLGVVIAGLGVIAVADHYDVFDTITSDCEMWLRNNTNFFAEDGLYVAERTYGAHKYYAISESFIQAVRDFLFQSGTLSDSVVITGADISCTSVQTGTNSFKVLCQSSPENLNALMKNLGIASHVFVYAQTDTILYGCYFDEKGRFCSRGFVNPLGVVHATQFGTFPYGALTVDSSIEINNVIGTYTPSSIIGGSSHPYPIYYSVEHGMADSSILAEDAMAFRWDTLPRIVDYTRGTYCGWTLAYKSASGVEFTGSQGGYLTLPGSGSCVGAFTWDTTTYSTVVSALDVVTSNVATSDKTLSEGYADWTTGAITLPGSTSIPNQDEEDKYYPIAFPPDISDVYEMTQEEAQGGTKTETDSNTGTNADPVTGTNLKSWFQNLTDSLSQWFSRLTLHVSNIFDALANLLALITSLIRSLLSHFKSIFLLGSLLGVLIEFLQALFGWLPESMFAALMLTFGVAIFYKFIGR